MASAFCCAMLATLNAMESAVAKGQMKSNKEAKKPKKEVKKTIAANPSTKGTLLKS